MKKTHIASLFAASVSIVLAASASAAPASKRTGPSASNNGSTSSSRVDHKVMKRIGPIGKGSVCTH